jgi:hypothetical protein
MVGASRLILLAAAASIPAALSAQGVFDMGMLTNSLSQGVNIRSEEARASRRTFPRLLRTTPSAAVRANPAAALYRPSAAIRQRNLKQFVERTKRLDHAVGADMERAFAKNDIMGQINAQMRGPLGLNPNSVADTMAVYLVTAYYASRGSDDSTPADFRAVARQMSRAVATTPEIARASDAVKQEIAESMMIQGVMTEQNVALIKKTNPRMMPQFRAAVATGAKRTFGMDLTRMRLGPNGLS